MSASMGGFTLSQGVTVSEKVRLWIMVVTFPVSYGLGVYGYCQYSEGTEPVSILNSMYHAAQLFVLHSPHFTHPVPWTLEIARWLSATSTGLVLLNTLLHLFHHQWMSFTIWRMRNHAIVCGLGRRGIIVTEKLHEQGIKVVVIDKNPEPEIIERIQGMGIPLVLGDATRKEVLAKAKVKQANQIFALCPDDTVNFTVAFEANILKGSDGTPMGSFIHINDTELRNELQANYRHHSDSMMKLHFIDAFEQEAISLLAHGLPIDHKGISPEDNRQVHVVILGFGRMGRTIAVKAAQLGQFANRKRLRISVIDRKAAENESALLFHHPFIKEVADFLFYKQEILSTSTRTLIEEWCSEPNLLVNLLFCIDHPSVAYDSVFSLLPVLKKKNIRVAVRVHEPFSFEFLLNSTGKERYENLQVHFFGNDKNFENLIDPEKNAIEGFAMDIHAAYVEITLEKYKNNPGKLTEEEDPESLKEWKELGEDYRESNRQQAVHMFIKVRACGYEIVDGSDPRPAINTFDPALFETLAIMEHDRWVAERKVNNWKFGNPSDKKNRINKNLVDWKDLEPHIKNYDYVAVERIPVLLGKIGKKMVGGNT